MASRGGVLPETAHGKRLGSPRAAILPTRCGGGVPRTAPLPSWGFPGAGRGHAGADLGSAGGGVPPSAPGRGRSRRRRRQVSERLLEVGFVYLHAVVMGVAARYPVPSTSAPT